MALIPIRVDRTSKPPIGTPLRSDGHWSVQGLVGAWAFNEGGGNTVFNAVGGPGGTVTQSSLFSPLGISPGDLSGGSRNVNLGSVPLGGGFFTSFAIVNLKSVSGTLCAQSSGPINYELRVVAGVVRVNSEIGSAQSGSAIASVGRHTITGVQDSFSIAGYYDGVFFNSFPTYGSRITTVSNIQMGATWYDNRDIIVELSLIYNIAISPDQVKSLSDNPWQIYEPETVWINVGAAVSLNQYSFRFLNDNGSESTATFAGAENANVNLSAGDTLRLRYLIDATGDPTGKQFQLEYRRKPSGGSFGAWEKVN
jgi:hypothetical protein